MKTGFKSVKLPTLIFLFFSGVILLSSRCKKNVTCTPAPVIKVMIPQELLDYVDFKAGSYWVYQDSASGRIDSEVVVSSRHVMDDKYASNNCSEVAITSQYENIEINMERYDSTGKLTYSWTRSFNNVAKMRDHSQDSLFIIDNLNSFYIGYPFKQKWTVASATCTCSFFDSTLLNGKWYFDVIKVSRINLDLPDDRSYIYHAKRIGKVHFDNFLTGRPNYPVRLLRYHIQK
jgi:hypothetical protein